MIAELKNKRKNWYSKIYVQYELLKAMRNKEVVFLDRIDNSKCIRGLMIRNIQALNYFFGVYNFFEMDYNIYVSCADYSMIPTFTVNLKERAKFTSKWFREKAENEIIGYDLLIDFDCKKVEEFNNMKREIAKFIQILRFYKVCFSFYPSGNNFQVVIDSTNHKIFNMKKINRLLKQIKERFGLKYFDLKGAGVFNKLRKCQYSLVSDKVVLPLMPILTPIDKYLEDIGYTHFECNNVLGNIQLQIKKRGLCKYAYLSPMENEHNFKVFLLANGLEG